MVFNMILCSIFYLFDYWTELLGAFSWFSIIWSNSSNSDIVESSFALVNLFAQSTIRSWNHMEMICVFTMQLAINLLRVLCTNTSWQRRKLGKILQDWRIIYVQVIYNWWPTKWTSLSIFFIFIMIIYINILHHLTISCLMYSCQFP